MGRVTFRDDHDAALQRIEALKADLKRAEADRDQAARERDQATLQRDRLANDVAKTRARAPEQRIVVVPKAPLTTREREDLVEALEHGASGNLANARIGTVVGVAMLAAALVAGLAVKVAIGLFLGLLGALIVLISLFIVDDAAEYRWRPVLADVRDAPHKIVVVRRLGDQYGWRLVVKTRTAELTMRGDLEVIKLLERHCPAARFEDDG
jgi:hypothetical protein